MNKFIKTTKDEVKEAISAQCAANDDLHEVNYETMAENNDYEHVPESRRSLTY
jgi:hypothetical protein